LVMPTNATISDERSGEVWEADGEVDIGLV